ncbi:MAG: DMT family transporter, partial [Alphaproteobacteria bacterium]
MRLRDMLIVFGIMLVWGANFVVSKLGLVEFPALLMMAIRFTLTAAVMVPFVRVPPRRTWPHYALLSLSIGSLHYGLMFSGLKMTDASTAAILIQLQVPFAALLAAAVLNDRLGWRRSLGMAIAFAGIVLIVGEPKIGGDPLALSLVLAAGFIWAIANVQIKWAAAHGHEMDPFALSAWVAVLAAPQLWLLTATVETDQMTAMREASWIGWG